MLLVNSTPHQGANGIRRDSPSNLAMVVKYLPGFRHLEGKVVDFKVRKTGSEVESTRNEN